MDLPSSFKQLPICSLGHHSSSHMVLQHTSDAQVETRVGPLAVAPPLSCGLKPKRKRASPIKVRLSEAEKELVRSKARQAGLSVNAFIKQVILDANYDPALRKALLAVYRELTAQGNNINQIARFVNSGQTTPVTGAEMVSNIALSVMKTHQAVRIALVQGKEMPER